MSGETDLIKLYSSRILALATDMPRVGRLEHPDATVKKRAPLCGSSVTVDLKSDGTTITDYAAEVKACALGQAAASVVARVIVGCSEAQARTAQHALRNMLAEDGPTPAAPFEDLEVLRAAKDFKNRHDSILLTLDAIAQALQECRASA